MDRVDYQSLIIQDFVNIQRSGELNLSPWYQRRSVWNPSQKAYLINTLLEQKPIPAIYIRHSLDLEKSRSIKEIVDGQQRTRTILGYCADEFAARHPGYPKKVKFSKLKKEDQHKFKLTAIPVGYLLGASDSDVIDIFGRINSISKSLNEQEKRNATYSGEMKQFCLKQASSRISFWRNYKIFSANDISRMNETQFMADIVYNLLNGLSDYSSKNLNRLYKEFDGEFIEADKISKRLDRVFDCVADIDPKNITDTIFNRQPIFFSLFVVLDSYKDISTNTLESAILNIDERFNSDENKSAEDIEFYNACTSSTQRISQRKIRDTYIKRFI